MVIEGKANFGPAGEAGAQFVDEGFPFHTCDYTVDAWAKLIDARRFAFWAGAAAALAIS